MGLGGEHHHLGTGREERADQVDPAADGLAEADVQQHALRLELPGVLDDVCRGRAVGGLDLPAACGQRQLETDGDQGVILDDENAPGHAATTVPSKGIERTR